MPLPVLLPPSITALVPTFDMLWRARPSIRSPQAGYSGTGRFICFKFTVPNSQSIHVTALIIRGAGHGCWPCNDMMMRRSFMHTVPCRTRIDGGGAFVPTDESVGYRRAVPYGTDFLWDEQNLHLFPRGLIAHRP